MASERAASVVPHPSFGQVICANTRCLLLYFLAYSAAFGGYYLAVNRDSISWAIVVSLLLILTTMASMKYRDVGRRHIGCKMVSLVLVITGDIFALMHILHNDEWILWITVILFTLAFLSGVIGICHSKVVIANLQPQIGGRIREKVFEDSVQL